MSGTPPPPARKSLGQHFLVDRAAIRRIVVALEASADTPVLEIGPGRGALTGDLVAAAGRIAAVELDRALAARLRERHPSAELLLYEQDVLDLDLAGVAPALGRVGPLHVAGNLPYNVSKPVADKLVRERRAVGRCVLMFQREVAQRLTATPASRAYGPLTVLVGAAYAVRVLLELRPGAFRPPPAVDSTVTVWDALDDPAFDPRAEAALRRTLAASFARRRATLGNNLRAALGTAESSRLLEEAGIDGSRRAEALAPAELRRLAALWPRTGGP